MELKYPYCTYEDFEYRQFMIEIMNALEIRIFEKGEIIVNEMDESLEILFVDQGFYEVGFKINNKTFFEAFYGMSTTIGGY